jgi:hypothetical protein
MLLELHQILKKRKSDVVLPIFWLLLRDLSALAQNTSAYKKGAATKRGPLFIEENITQQIWIRLNF